MELYQLTAFVTVAEIGNVTRSAERLFASQPAVSAQIKALEDEFGVRLFDRTPGGMRLTESGARLLPHARHLVDQARLVEGLARDLRNGLVGSLRVGINNQGPLFPVDRIAREIAEHSPQLALQFEFGPSGAIRRGLKTQDFDVGFVEGPLADAALIGRTIGHTQVRIAVPAEWAGELAEGDWAALGSKPWLLTSPDCSYRAVLQSLSAEHGWSLRMRYQLDNDRTTLHFVKAGLGASLVDARYLEAAVAAGEVFVWPRFERELPLHVVALRRRADEPAIAAFINAVGRVFESHPAAEGVGHGRSALH